jgi:hypothetical protein
MSKGIGYQDYRKKRITSEGLRSSQIESKGYERYSIYFGRAHCFDHETNIEARGQLKIGRGKFTTALMRGRNQPGIDFRVYGEIILDSDKATYDAEKVIKGSLSHRHLNMSQGQQELYDIKDNELSYTIETIAEILKSELFTINEVNIFLEKTESHNAKLVSERCDLWSRQSD